MPVPKGRKGVQVEMEKFKAGKLHSGSPSGPIVKKKSQAIAIALSEAGMSNRMGGRVTHEDVAKRIKKK